jgi:hypothetical protein
MDLIPSNARELLISAEGFLFGAVVTYLLGLSRDYRAERRRLRINAAQSIISTFTPELDAIIQNNDDCRHVLTSQALNKHETAIRNALPYFSCISRWRLRNAWRVMAYISQDKKYMYPIYGQYIDGGSLDKRKVLRPLAISRIERIISIARSA